METKFSTAKPLPTTTKFFLFFFALFTLFHPYNIAVATVETGTITGGQANQQGGQFVKLDVPFSESSPANTVGENNFQNPNLYAFDEDQNIQLNTDLPVDLLASSNSPGVISAGETVASHYVFFDPSPLTTVSAEVSFDSEIVGIITSRANLQASDFLANTGVNYLSPDLRSLEPNDTVTIIDANTISIDWSAGDPGDYIRVLTRFSPGAADCAVEVVFAVDTSGSMNDDIGALCENISAVEEQLLAQGINAKTHILGITRQRACLTSTVVAEVGSVVPGNNGACGSSLNQLESWGQATASLARNFAWTPGATRVVIPISDEGPCDGGGGPDFGGINQADRDAITNAIDQAQRAGVFVSPITASGSDQEMIDLAAQLATATGGTNLQSSDPDLDIAGLVGTLVEGACSGDVCEVIESLGDQERPVTFRPLGVDASGFVNAQFYEPTESLLISKNAPLGQPANFGLLAADGAQEDFSDVSGIQNQVGLAVARSSQTGGFTDGDDIPIGTTYVGTNNEGELLRINPDRSVETITTSANGVFTSIYIDSTGSFAGDVIAVATDGSVMRIDETNAVNRIAQINGALIGLAAIPNNQIYGDLAGKLLIGDSDLPDMYAVDEVGNVTVYADIGLTISDIDLIPENENFFGINLSSSDIFGAEAIQWIGYKDQILLTKQIPNSGTSGLYLLDWENGIRVRELEITAESTLPSRWESVGFAPVGILELPTPPICGLSGKPDLTNSTPRLNTASCPGTLVVNAEVGNIGLGVAPKGTRVDISSNGNSLGSLILQRDLAPGDFETVSVSNNDFVAFEQTIEVTSDVNNILQELNENNNVSSAIAGQCTVGCVEDLAVRVKRNKIQLTWTHLTDASYEIERTTDLQGTWQNIAQTTSEYSTYLDTSPPIGENVYYRIVRSPGSLGEEFCTSEPIAAFAPGGRSRTRLATIPDLTGLSVLDAEQALTQARLRLGSVSALSNTTQADGLVFTQQPPPRSQVVANSSVALSTAINPVPVNNPPVIDNVEQFTIDEGERYVLRAQFSDDDSTSWRAQVNFGDGQALKQLFVADDKQVVASTIFADNATMQGNLQITDEGDAQATEAFEINVRNVAPKVFVGESENVTRDSAFQRSGFFTDPGADEWSATVSWGDGTPEQDIQLNADKTFVLNHTFTTEGVFTVTVRVSDDDADEGSDQFTVRVLGPSVTVPNVTGLSLFDANNLIENASLVTGEVRQIESRTVASGAIIQQNPAAGTLVAEGLSVSLQLSVGNINEDPEITSSAPSTAIEGLAFNYPVTAQDPDQDQLTFSLLSAPSGMTMSSSGVISWTPTPDQIGRVTATAKVTDEFGASDQQTFAVRVAANIPVTLSDLSGGTRGQVEQSLEEQGLFVGEITVVVDTSVAPGTVLSTSVAPGTTLQAGSSVGLVVAVSALRDTPSVNISSPTPSVVLGMPTQVVGTVEPATLGVVAENPITWELILTRAGDPSPKVISNGSGAIFGERLGTIDPTILANDSYKLALRYQQGGFVGTSTVPFDVEGELKLGNFRVDFTDLELNYNDLPIVVAREYDTLDLADRDFGFGWRLSTPGDVRDGAAEGTPFVRGTKVFVSLPGGERYGFNFQPQPLSFLFPWISNVIFEPEPGVTGSLEAVGAGSVFSIGGLYTNLISPYNPRLYRYTTADGIEFVIDEFDGLRSAKDANGNELFYGSDGILDANGNGVQFVRDAQNRITDVLAPDGTGVTYEYSADGDLILVTDQNNNVTSIEYDAGLAHYVSRILRDETVLIQPIFSELDGRLVAVCSGDDNPETLEGCTEMSFDPENRSQRLVQPGNRISDVIYDAQGNIEKETIFLENGDTLTDIFAYDERSNQTLISDSGGYQVELAYDDANNIKTINMLGQVGEFTHNNCNQITSYRLNGSLVHTYTYDTTGCNLTEVLDASGKIIEYQYDTFGRNTAIVDPVGNTTSFSYNGDGKLIDAIDALGANSGFTYDLSNRLQSRTDRNGNTINFSYDAVGNMVRETWVGTSPLVEINYVYDQLDRVIEMDGPNSRIQIEYNEAGERERVSTTRKTIVAGTEVVSYEYDGMGNITRILDSDGGEITINSDNANRPTLVTQTGLRQRSATFEFDDSNVLRKVNYFNDSIATELAGYSEFEYACPGCVERPELISHYTAAGVPIVSYDIELNEFHDITAIETEQGRTQFSFDARRQLTAVTPPAGSNMPAESYTYDLAGNRLASDFAGTHQLIQTNNGGNRIAENALYEFEYDAEGNLTAKVDKATLERVEYSYDYRGRLVEATSVGTNNGRQIIATYYYDLLDRRIAKVTPDSTSLYVNAGRNLLLEKDDNGNQIKRHFFEPRFPDVTLAYELASEDQWLFTDQVGTVRHALSDSGEVTALDSTSRFGRITDSNVNDTFPAVFGATELDTETGLYYARSRYYDPELGRFISEDPLSFLGGDANLYRYSKNNPVRFLDPFGRASLSYAQINQRIAVFQRAAIKCLGDAVFTNAAEIGVYLIIEAVATKYSRSGPSNVYAGRTRNKKGFKARFYQHGRKGRRAVSTITFRVNQNIIDNPRAFAELEQLLIDSFGGKAQLTNKVNAVSKNRKNVFCVK